MVCQRLAQIVIFRIAIFPHILRAFAHRLFDRGCGAKATFIGPDASPKDLAGGTFLRLQTDKGNGGRKGLNEWGKSGKFCHFGSLNGIARQWGVQ